MNFQRREIRRHRDISQRWEIRQRSGLTLIEVVVSTAIVALIISAALRTVSMAVQLRSKTAILRDGPALASNLIAEISANAYIDPQDPSAAIGPNSGENIVVRSDFDDIDDFHGWSSAPPVDSAGVSLADYAGWSRAVTVEFVNPTDLSTTVNDLGLKRIQVTVTSPSSEVTSLSVLRSSQGLNQRSLHADRTVVTQLDVSIVSGSSASAQTASAFLKNHALD
ncbi:MAG TPA: hypothetical protein DDW52_09955 [Planctomycetaceae bacterium]|nr:hypothetical protein [Planctomycetaceae bacterium]